MAHRIEAERLPGVMGVLRLRVRVVVSGPNVPPGNRAILLTIRAQGRTDIRVALRDATGAGTLDDGKLSVPVTEDWTEVFFSLNGARDEQVPIEVLPRAGVELAAVCSVEGLFDAQAGGDFMAGFVSVDPRTLGARDGRRAARKAIREAALGTAKMTVEEKLARNLRLNGEIDGAPVKTGDRSRMVSDRAGRRTAPDHTAPDRRVLAAPRPAEQDVEPAGAETDREERSSTRRLADEPPGWACSFPDEGSRSVFLHLDRHGSIGEVEITHLLGSPRAFRRFSVEFDGYVLKVPFKVRIEAGADGKRYVKEGEK